MKRRDRPSANFDARPGKGSVDMLILHYTGMRTAQEALDLLVKDWQKVFKEEGKI